jgi:hypothetical protein
MTGNVESVLETRRLMAHLLVLPRADTRRSNENRTTVARLQSLFETLLKGLARRQVPFVEPRTESGFEQPAG